MIKLNCNQVGEDEFGNTYFEEKSATGTNKKKRFIIYNGQVEASKIPPRWHLWIHYTSDEIPNNGKASTKYSWQKIHLPNLTGTSQRHSPKNKAETRKAVSSDYESWN